MDSRSQRSVVYLFTSANNKCSSLFDLQENKEDLSRALVELRAIRDGVKIRVDDAENNPNQKCTPEVDSWLKCVQTIDDEVVQVIQKADEEIQGRCFGANCPVNCCYAGKIDKLVLRKLQIVNDLKSKRDSFGEVTYTIPPPLAEFPGMGNDVLPLLKLISYDNLGDDMIKSCFLFCALYPEDWSIHVPKLIDYWIGEGLISLNAFNHIDEARNLGHEIIGILKGASLLENDRNKDIQVKMHDTIRHLALWIAHDCEISRRDKMLTIKTSDLMTPTPPPERSSSSSWYNAERIYVSFFSDVEMGVTITISTKNSPKLLTLIFNCHPHTLLDIPPKFFSLMPLLRVLDFSYCRIDTFPTSIIELVELRYLNLSMTGIQVLPGELRKLVKLNYLDLSYMERLKTIPSGVIGSLLELRVLNLFCCCAVWDFDELYALKHLNDLGININTQPNLNKMLLSNQQSLQMCTRGLHLFSSPSPSPSPSSSSSSSTTTTTLGFGSIMSLEKLELLSNLEKLGLDSLPELMNVNMGVWRENHFQKLGQITIGHCNALKDLTWVGYVSNLKSLSVSHCEEIVIVIVDDFGGSTAGGDEITMVMNNVFKRLDSLILTFLPKLESICSHALAFPCLESMIVGKCPQLKKLPFDSGSNVNNTLQSITGEGEWWNALQWGEDHDNNELLKSKFLPYFHPF